MDATTAERINTLAKNLRDLHMAATMEEAFQKAREIILGTAGEGRSLKETYAEQGMLRDVETAAVAEAQTNAEAANVIGAMAEFKEAQTKDELNSLELTQETTRLGEQLKREQAQLEKVKGEIERAKQQLEDAKKVHAATARQAPSMEPFTHPPVDEAPAERPRLSDEEKKKSDLSRIFNFGKR